jgi:long-chain acyl-CoA synthetase
LPGVRTRLKAFSELELSGHYIGRYLEDAGPGDVIPYPVSEEEDAWLATGDVFTVTEDGYYQIIDRVKDIYKNNRGQTVAPQVIEKKFYNVPGIKNTFLVGDNRPYNVLLIAPDREDPLFSDLSGDNLNEYLHQIVMAANADAAPYERVINFTLISRDFSHEAGELTPKGSFNRKTIEKNFLEVIETLYISNVVVIRTEEITIRIPRWFFRDLGILENDILFEDGRLFNRRKNRYLHIRKEASGSIEIGDLKYRITQDEFDLGIFARQPQLWIGNPELVAFCPVKEGWDLSPGKISESVYFVPGRKYRAEDFPAIKSLRNEDLQKIHNLVCSSLFLPFEESFRATTELGGLFNKVEPRLALVIRIRMEALAYHAEEEIRTLAYRTILLKAPDPQQIRNLPVFIESGLSFLNEKSIREIAAGNFGKHRLDALMQRLYWYRTNMVWPANEKNRLQFGSVLKMLFNFAVMHLEYYVPIRAELSRWILLRKDPFLSQKAEGYFDRLAEEFEKAVNDRTAVYPPEVWKKKVLFEYGLQDVEKERILNIFQSTNYLAESIILAFSQPDFDLEDVPGNGIWVLRLQAYKEFRHYRLSINTRSGKHYDLHMVMSEDPAYRPKPDTFYWLASLAGFPNGAPVGPFLGSSRPGLGILSTEYIGGLTAWDKIREFAEIHKSAGFVRTNSWKKVFTKAFTVIFRAWHHSGYQIVPGIISPNNVAVPEMDFRQNAILVSLTGWTAYRNTISLVGPILQDFYCKTAALYPWCSKQLDVSWIFDACIEALGKEEATEFLEILRKDLLVKPVSYFDGGNLADDLQKYTDTSLKRYYLPLALFSAIDQYGDWYKMNPLTTSAAKEQTLFELLELYQLQVYHDLVRYCFYRHSYFLDFTEEVRQAFDKLIEKMMADQNVLPIQLVELSALQSVIRSTEDRNVFSRMVFPRLLSEQKVDFMKVGERLKEHLVVKFDLTDKTGTHYIQRDPVEPREIGQLYQMFFRENYPKEISYADHHYVVTDEYDRIIGGMTWRNLENHNVLLDGIVVTSVLQGRGIASGMIENFFTSMAAQGVQVVKAHFLLGNYYLKHYFEVDKKWGALIKTLNG